ncbi:hypothetical protein RND71_022155 [Anisodus tanguticus]|uniref:Uncharacterized protein n=1 Tax=Anisodus tanguticus TaxID=243964 RepID=A0AAE1RY00_9SOLA|nr:hypothetical protein RND71_022155 [Anisodus tanguticus]
MMEKKEIKLFKHNNKTQKRRVEEEEDDLENLETISLSDLQMNKGNESPKNSSSPQDFFEFFTESSDSENYNTFSDIIFCGKIISHDNDIDERQFEEEQLNNENLSPLFRSNSFHRPVIGVVKQNRVMSARFYGSPNLASVNITGLTSMSAKSRKRMFMFGPVKFKPEMELSEIKQRQGRRRCAPTTMTKFPASDGRGTTALVKSSQKKNKSGSTGKWMELRCKPHVNVLAKSLSCFSMRKHCMALP